MKEKGGRVVEDLLVPSEKRKLKGKHWNGRDCWRIGASTCRLWKDNDDEVNEKSVTRKKVENGIEPGSATGRYKNETNSFAAREPDISTCSSRIELFFSASNWTCNGCSDVYRGIQVAFVDSSIAKHERCTCSRNERGREEKRRVCSRENCHRILLTSELANVYPRKM